MLFLLITRTIGLLSTGAGWLSHGIGDAPVQSGNTPVTPQDPSTLTLALIGAGTIAVFLVARWRPLRTGVGRLTGRFSDRSLTGDAAEGVEQRRSRGAA